jgi:hypothetical protein
MRRVIFPAGALGCLDLLQGLLQRRGQPRLLTRVCWRAQMLKLADRRAGAMEENGVARVLSAEVDEVATDLIEAHARISRQERAGAKS